MQELWIATSNQHKLEELDQLFDHKITIKSLKDLETPLEIEENGKTFAQNALIKAKALYELVKQPVLADDSGIEIAALNGRPGIFSSRFLGEGTDYALKNQAVIETLNALGKPRDARYVCALAYVDEKGKPSIYEAEMKGHIALEPKGKNGFGYDPVFFFDELGMSNGELPPEIKNKYSHRGKALEMFKKDILES